MMEDSLLKMYQRSLLDAQKRQLNKQLDAALGLYPSSGTSNEFSLYPAFDQPLTVTQRPSRKLLLLCGV